MDIKASAQFAEHFDKKADLQDQLFINQHDALHYLEASLDGAKTEMLTTITSCGKVAPRQRKATIKRSNRRLASRESRSWAESRNRHRGGEMHL
jgi:hypothetical protein